MKRPFKLLTMTVILIGMAGLCSCGEETPVNFGNMSVTDITDTGATLQWNAVQGAESYEVMIGSDIVVPTTDISYSVMGLLPGTEYSWQVRVLKGGRVAETLRGKPFSTLRLISPFDLEVTDLHFTGATLSWKASSAATGYKIRIGDAEPVDVADNSYVVKDLEGYATYKWQVCSVGSYGVSEWSEGKPFTTIHKFVFIHDGFYGEKFDNGTHNTTFQFLEFDPKAPLKEITGWEVYIDLVSTLMDMKRPVLDIPEGTYTYSNSYEANTISPDFTFLRPVKEGKMSVVYRVESGTVKFTGDHRGYKMNMDFIIFLTNNDGSIERSEFHAWWSGPLNIDNPLMYSNFTEDQAIGTLPMAGGVTYAPDCFGDGSADVYLVGAMQPGTDIRDGLLVGNGWVVSGVQFSAAVGSGPVIPDGTYTIEDSLAPGYVLAGYYDNLDKALYGVWVRLVENDEVVGYAPVISGKVTSTCSNGSYNIVIDGYDDAGYHITCTITGGEAAPNSIAASSSATSVFAHAPAVSAKSAVGDNIKGTYRVPATWRPSTGGGRIKTADFRRAIKAGAHKK